MPLSLKFTAPIAQSAVPTPAVWRGCSAEEFLLSDEVGFTYTLAGDSHYLALHNFELENGEIHVDGQRPVVTRNLRDSITFLPKGRPASGWAEPAKGPNSFLAVYFDADALHTELAARYAAATEQRALICTRHPGLHSTLTKLRSLVRDGSDPLHAESLCLVAALEVLKVSPEIGSGQLSGPQMARVRDYINDHIHTKIGLDDLANVAGLSRFHFSRAFKASTGQSPHRFVADKRIELARRILMQTEHALDVVAVNCGFSSAAMLRRAFVQSVGTTPQLFRRDAR